MTKNQMGRKFTRSHGRAGPPSMTRWPTGLVQVKHSLFGHAGPTKRFHDHVHAGATRQFYTQAKPSQHTAARLAMEYACTICLFYQNNFLDALLAGCLVSTCIFFRNLTNRDLKLS